MVIAQTLTCCPRWCRQPATGACTGTSVAMPLDNAAYASRHVPMPAGAQPGWTEKAAIDNATAARARGAHGQHADDVRRA